MPKIVSNTGPLIALASISQLDLLYKLFDNLLIPSAVRAEILSETAVSAVAAADWITVHVVQDSIAVQLLKEELDAGESEAIVLARELDAELVLIDERAARRKARSLGLQTIGTLGVLLMAKDKGQIVAIKPLLKALRDTGFHMSNDLYRQVMDSGGETEEF